MTRQQRLDLIASLLLAGLTHAAIIAQVVAEAGVTAATVQKDINELEAAEDDEETTEDPTTEEPGETEDPDNEGGEVEETEREAFEREKAEWEAQKAEDEAKAKEEREAWEKGKAEDEAELEAEREELENQPPKECTNDDPEDMEIDIELTEEEKSNAELRKGRVEKYTVKGAERKLVHVEVERVNIVTDGGKIEKTSKPQVQKYDPVMYRLMKKQYKSLGYDHVREIYNPEK